MDDKTALLWGTLPKETKAVFDLLSKQAELKDFSLIGGTALALQIAHRSSLDIDLAVYGKQLPSSKLDAMVSRMQGQKHNVVLTTSQSQISAFRINSGESLLDHVRDYAIDGVKTTFLADWRGNGKLVSFMKKTSRLEVPGGSFGVLGVDGIKVLKVLVLSRRVVSRDLFDIMAMMEKGRLSLSEMRSIVETYSPNNDFEYFKSVLDGRIRVDVRSDPGLRAVGVQVNLKRIYGYFREKIGQYEQELSFQAFLNNGRGR